MAFPAVAASTSFEQTTTTQTHVITLPAHNPGDLLIVIFSIRYGSTNTNTLSGSGNWNTVFEHKNGTNVMTQFVLYKIAKTSSESLTITCSGAAIRSMHLVYRITGAFHVTGSAANMTGTNYNCPSHSPGVSRDFLWIPTHTISGVVTVTQPTDYSNLLTDIAAASTNNTTSAARRELNASTTDPGTWTNSSAVGVAGLLAVWPTGDFTRLHGTLEYPNTTGQRAQTKGHTSNNLFAALPVAGNIPESFNPAILSAGDYIFYEPLSEPILQVASLDAASESHYPAFLGDEKSIFYEPLVEPNIGIVPVFELEQLGTTKYPNVASRKTVLSGHISNSDLGVFTPSLDAFGESFYPTFLGPDKTIFYEPITTPRVTPIPPTKFSIIYPDRTFRRQPQHQDFFRYALPIPPDLLIPVPGNHYPNVVRGGVVVVGFSTSIPETLEFIKIVTFAPAVTLRRRGPQQIPETFDPPFQPPLTVVPLKRTTTYPNVVRRGHIVIGSSASITEFVIPEIPTIYGVALSDLVQIYRKNLNAAHLQQYGDITRNIDIVPDFGFTWNATYPDHFGLLRGDKGQIKFSSLIGSFPSLFRIFRDFGIRIHDNFSVTLFRDLIIRLDVKRETDQGVVNALASDHPVGTPVLFNKLFKDVDSITVSVNDTTEKHVIYDFTDVPNPTGFTVLVFNTVGSPVDASVSWIARGIV